MQITCASDKYYFMNIKNECFTLQEAQLVHQTKLTEIFKGITPVSA